ncbi:hypothetical protein HRbin39_00309 [bacterium HR39]|nr:hypothetical protein HRbin39_00309 [bacterium HR39]
MDLQASSTIELEYVDIGDSVPASLERLDPIARARDLSARWRALKRLAEQGRHHYYTALFARNEMRAREPLDRQQRPVAALIGRWYGLLSDYGLSLWRPWAWWGGTLAICFALFWAFHVLFLPLGHPIFACHSDSELTGFSPWSALLLSLRQGSVFGNLASLPGTGWITECLYGKHLPGIVMVLAGLQTAFSALLLFLFGLAVRNHFRVR